jgi:hypothetical protein
MPSFGDLSIGEATVVQAGKIHNLLQQSHGSRDACAIWHGSVELVTRISVSIRGDIQITIRPKPKSIIASLRTVVMSCLPFLS